MSEVLAVINEVAMRLSDPRQWLQGTWQGKRGRDGFVEQLPQGSSGANCWCLSQAINIAVGVRAGTVRNLAELRSDVETELLRTLELAGITGFGLLYVWNDARSTTFEQVTALLAASWMRVSEAA